AEQPRRERPSGGPGGHQGPVRRARYRHRDHHDRLLWVWCDRLPHSARPGARRLWTHPAVSRIVEPVGWRRLVAGGSGQPGEGTATGLTPGEQERGRTLLLRQKVTGERALIVLIRVRGEPIVRPRRHSGQ